MNRIRHLTTTLLITVLAVTAFAGCSSNQQSKLESGDITKDNLRVVCEVLKDRGLSNVDTFEQWVEGYLNGDAESGDSSGFTDADCRMTVMLLAGDSISSNSVEEAYDGTYLMFDVEAIENQGAFSVLKDKEQLFTTLFGEMPIPASGFKDAFPTNLDTYGIRFGGERFSVISILFKAYEEDFAFVGHTGVLIDCKGNENVDTDYLFVEKIAFNDAYKVTKVNDETELLKILSDRPDYTMEEGDPKPLVYRNEKLIGELQI